MEERLQVFGQNIVDFINVIYPDGAPVGSRHKSALKLASDLMILLDGDERLVKIVLEKISWVQDVINERGEREIDDIIDSAKKLLKRRESESFADLLPSREMQAAIKELVHKTYKQLVEEARAQRAGGKMTGDRGIVETLERIGRELEKYFK